MLSDTEPNRAELRAYLLLLALKAMRFRDLRKIARQLGCQAALQSLHSTFSTHSETFVNQQLAWMEAAQVQYLHISQAKYPSTLRAAPDPPAWLFTQGDIQVLQQPCLAVVGSRQASLLAEELASSICQTYADTGGCIVSGLAKGVDTAAHKGALQANGKTASVFGCGLDVIYPSRNSGLAKQIARSGICISEYPPKTSPQKYQFPERNRIIAGLCEGTVIIEAAIRSGSLITAKMALEAGREVFAVPGSIWDKKYQGSHLLIQQGAKLVQNINDILEDLPSFREGALAFVQAVKAEEPKTPEARQGSQESGLEAQILSQLSYQLASVEKLAGQCGASISEASAALAALEISGKAVRQTSGYRRPGHIPESQRRLF